MGPKKRKQLTPGLIRRLEFLFRGQTCIVTGADDAQWDHLDDDTERSVLSNLVPISASLNVHKRDLNSRVDKPHLVLRGLIEPSNLLARAHLHFADWEVGRAYGCARLAFYVARNYQRASPQVLLRYAGKALYYARHKLNHEILEDIIKRDIIPSLERAGHISADVALDLARPLGALLSEQAKPTEAMEVFTAIDWPKISHTILEHDPVSYASLVRRRATILAGCRKPLYEVQALLRDASEAAPWDENAKVSVVNSEAWARISGRDYKGLFDVIQPVCEDYLKKCFTPGEFLRPVAVSIYNMTELATNYAVALAQVQPSGWDPRLKDLIDKCRLLYARAGSKLTELHPGYYDALFDARVLKTPAAELVKFRRNALPAKLTSVVNDALRILRQTVVVT